MKVSTATPRDFEESAQLRSRAFLDQIGVLVIASSMQEAYSFICPGRRHEEQKR
jgi:hypothetical protein